jgi:hypothetical protein
MLLKKALELTGSGVFWGNMEFVWRYWKKKHKFSRSVFGFPVEKWKLLSPEHKSSIAVWVNLSSLLVLMTCEFKIFQIYRPGINEEI